MQSKFSSPKTKEEFLEQSKDITLQGARAVSQGLDVKLKRVAGPLMSEKQFFDEVATYLETGKIPERFENVERA